MIPFDPEPKPDYFFVSHLTMIPIGAMQLLVPVRGMPHNIGFCRHNVEQGHTWVGGCSSYQVGCVPVPCHTQGGAGSQQGQKGELSVVITDSGWTTGHAACPCCFPMAAVNGCVSSTQRRRVGTTYLVYSTYSTCSSRRKKGGESAQILSQGCNNLSECHRWGPDILQFTLS